ncbi:MAG: 50S ribosomal protein L6 [Planctomycetaceae bacterium]|nr:50S ribosomal protein L6 [Planctomycetaceae bacterium]MCP4462823.1 50S ribosomal protein L6 [Planctomycetaceae bacterium]MDG1808065.1 50S ribosomal protein L6 [Pirellulaceae bacterium]MDG2102128.1 50S ribosomal protein L6 [Pirellulaceae bacterium]
MSRVGNQPIPIPAGITAKVDGNTFHAEGPKGKLAFEFRSEVKVDVNDTDVIVSRHKDDRFSKAFHGTTRALINNMIIGVKDGYEKKLELQGVGYVCNVSGKTLSLRVGLANELKMEIPVGLDVTCPDNTHIDVKGCDKQLVGKFAAEVRSLRKPEPYKGKGIRYFGEQVKIKPGKAAS